jgi:hypothetical protein
MEEQIAIERILETENLTDGLEDDDAQWLLDWGIAQVHGLIDGIEDDDLAGAKVNALMAVMRRLNQIAADREVLSVDVLSGEIRDFAKLYPKAFGKQPHIAKINTATYTHTAEIIRNQTPLDAIQTMLALVIPAPPKPPAKPVTRRMPDDPDNPNSSSSHRV